MPFGRRQASGANNPRRNLRYLKRKREAIFPSLRFQTPRDRLFSAFDRRVRTARWRSLHFSYNVIDSQRFADNLGLHGAFMISQELLDILRCPLDPSRAARLEEEGDALVCQRCRLRYPIKEGLPCMLVEEAQLPPGITGLQALPCQQTPVEQGAKT